MRSNQRRLWQVVIAKSNLINYDYFLSKSLFKVNEDPRIDNREKRRFQKLIVPHIEEVQRLQQLAQDVIWVPIPQWFERLLARLFRWHSNTQQTSLRSEAKLDQARKHKDQAPLSSKRQEVAGEVEPSSIKAIAVAIGKIERDKYGQIEPTDNPEEKETLFDVLDHNDQRLKKLTDDVATLNSWDFAFVVPEFNVYLKRVKKELKTLGERKDALKALEVYARLEQHVQATEAHAKTLSAQSEKAPIGWPHPSQAVWVVITLTLEVAILGSLVYSVMYVFL